MITPIPFDQAEDSVRKNYLKLMKAFNAPSIPIFFTYIASFPEYLDYITSQLVKNIEHPNFTMLSTEVGEELLSLIQKTIPSSQSQNNWIHQYRHTDSFYHFKKDIEHIYSTNIAIMFIFIALREAVKGWAVAAKRLPENRSTTKQNINSQIKEAEFIFDIYADVPVQNHGNKSLGHSFPLDLNENSIQKRTSTEIQTNLLPEYLEIVRKEFEIAAKTEDFLLARVTIEKIILTSLHFLPNLIFSPINVTLELVKKYDNFPDLLYLLCEQFPTYAVQRVMFSGMLRKDI